MAGFKWAYDRNGAKVPFVKPMYIPTATVLEEGEIVDFTPGTGVIVLAEPTDFDNPAIGVAVSAHAASTGNKNEYECRISTSPSAVYSLKSTNVITATGGSTTTFVVSGLLPATDDLWIGGKLHIVACAADSTLNGTDIAITDSTGAGGTLTFATQTGAFASGDTAYLCPGPRAIGEFGWDLTSDATDVDWDTSAGEGLILVDVAPDKFLSYWQLRLHKYAQHMLAI